MLDEARPRTRERLARPGRRRHRELRRRIGETFTLAELRGRVPGAEQLGRDAVAEPPPPGWPRTLSLVEDAAFHLYARGAVDYAP